MVVEKEFVFVRSVSKGSSKAVLSPSFLLAHHRDQGEIESTISVADLHCHDCSLSRAVDTILSHFASTRRCSQNTSQRRTTQQKADIVVEEPKEAQKCFRTQRGQATFPCRLAPSNPTVANSLRQKEIDPASYFSQHRH